MRQLSSGYRRRGWRSRSSCLRARSRWRARPELFLPSVLAALPVLGHPSSTGCELDLLMDARTCADLFAFSALPRLSQAHPGAAAVLIQELDTRLCEHTLDHIQ